MRCFLRTFFRWRPWAVLFGINLFCDGAAVVKVMFHPNQKYDELFFEKFFCNSVGIFELAVFFLLFGFLLFQWINALRNDNQKSGLFVLTRIPRKKYTFLRFFSFLLYLAAAVLFSALLAFLLHRITGFALPAKLYFRFAANYFLLAGFCLFTAGILHCVTKSSALAYIGGMLAAFFCCLFTAQQFAQSSVQGLPFLFLALAFVTAAGFLYLTQRGDFLTTKIKE